MKKQILAVALVATMGATLTGCCNSCKTEKTETTTKTTCEMKTKIPYKKKYTNADYYKDGKFQGDVALKAYEEMLAHYEIKISDFMRKNLWITDFNLGDFENVGMAGLFWVNDPVNNYFGHEIYLLPNQMIAEHRHIKSEFDAKMESWLVRDGSCFNFATGEAMANAPKLPESQKEYITAKAFQCQNEGDVVHLNLIESSHFIIAGDGGATITEFASYHDGNGLRFTNPAVEFIDILTAGK